MSTYSEAFNKLHKLSIDSNTKIEDFDAREPIELATRNISSMLGLHMIPIGENKWSEDARNNMLGLIGRLTKNEWDHIRFTMLGNIQLITNASEEYKNRRIDWIRDLDTIYAMGSDEQ